MVSALEPSLVRILGPDGAAPVGAGCLVTDRHVVTCAHVIAEALGIDEMQPDARGAEVLVDFAFSEEAAEAQGQVEAWWPAADPDSPPRHGKADVAVLSLRGE